MEMLVWMLKFAMCNCCRADHGDVSLSQICCVLLINRLTLYAVGCSGTMEMLDCQRLTLRAVGCRAASWRCLCCGQPWASTHRKACGSTERSRKRGVWRKGSWTRPPCRTHWAWRCSPTTWTLCAASISCPTVTASSSCCSSSLTLCAWIAQTSATKRWCRRHRRSFPCGLGPTWSPPVPLRRYGTSTPSCWWNWLMCGVSGRPAHSWQPNWTSADWSPSWWRSLIWSSVSVGTSGQPYS